MKTSCKTFLIIFAILFDNVCWAELPPPPVIPDVKTAQYLQSLYNNTNTLNVSSTSPNGNRVGRKGELVLYNGSIWYNTGAAGFKTWVNINNVTYPLSTANGGTGSSANANASQGVVILDSSGRLPAVDGSQLTNLPPPTFRLKVGNFTRDISTGSESISYTGVGFQPTYIIFTASAGSPLSVSSGYDNATIHFCTYNTATNTGNVNNSNSIVAYESAGSGNGNTGYVSSFGADGFTIAWTKAGSASSVTASIDYIAFK